MTKEEFMAMSLPYGLMIQYEGVVNGKELSKYDKEVEKAEKETPDDFFAGFYVPVVIAVNGLKVAPLTAITAYKSYIKYEVGYKRFKVLHNPKPILRPLSDLTKEIEHKGEKFVPIDYLWHEVISTDSDCFDRSDLDILVEYCTELAPFKVVSKLAEWHFAVGLDENDFIDVNTLEENPYK